MCRDSASCEYPWTGCFTAPRGCRSKVPQGMRHNRAHSYDTGKALFAAWIGSISLQLFDEHHWMPGSGCWLAWRAFLGLFIVTREPIVKHPVCAKDFAIPYVTQHSGNIDTINDIVSPTAECHTPRTILHHHTSPTLHLHYDNTHHNPHIGT